MEEKNYRVLRIEEQLYGCEELPEGQPVLCDVLLEAADGTQRVLPYPDAELTVYPEEGHGFSSQAMQDVNRRLLGRISSGLFFHTKK